MSDTEVSPPSHAEPAPKKGGAFAWLLFLLTAAALGAVLYYGRDMVGAEKARAEAAIKDGAEARNRADALEREKKALEEQLAKLEDERTALAANLDEVSQQLQQTEAELAKIKATYDSLEDKMKAEIKKGEIKLSQLEGRIKVDLVDKVLFDSGQAELSPRGQEILQRLGTILGGIEDKRIQVSGHTDDSPITKELSAKFPSNWELSTARAVNVVRFLSETGGVAPKKLVAAGHGQFQPVATNANPRGRAQNRRIEILLIPELPKKKAGAKTAAK